MLQAPVLSSLLFANEVTSPFSPSAAKRSGSSPSTCTKPGRVYIYTRLIFEGEVSTIMSHENFEKIGLPRIIEYDRQYKESLQEAFEVYNDWVSQYEEQILQQALMLAGRSELLEGWTSVNESIQNTERLILSAIDEYYGGKINHAQNTIFQILSELIANDSQNFLVSDIDKSYATRMVAPFPELHSKVIDYEKEYELMNHEELTFFRARVSHVDGFQDMLHIPLSQRDAISTQRFSVPGTPCLYLGTSSYDVWRELDRPAYCNFNVSALKIKPQAQRQPIKILNLINSSYFMYGLVGIPTKESITRKTVDLLCQQLQIWPFVCATSFKVKNSAKNFRSEYIISHLIMMSLQQLGIDGVAYTSNQLTPSEEPLAVPLMVNLALPVFSDSVSAKYGPICNNLLITDPVNFEEYQGLVLQDSDKNHNTSYFAKACKEPDYRPSIIYCKRGVHYRNTAFFKFDNFLCSQQFYEIEH